VLNTPALYLADGAVLEADAVLLQEGGTLGGDGALTLPLTNSGTLAPGGVQQAGRFTLASDYAQAPEGALRLDLGGLTPGTEHDQLAVTGTAVLDGTVALGYLGGYVPTVGDTYTLVTAGAVEGLFASVEPTTGLTVELDYTATAVTATVLAVTANEPEAEAPPAGAVLRSVHPNPARTTVTVTFEVPTPGRVGLAVYDLLGREVAELVNGAVSAGRHDVVLDADGLANGVYLVRLVTEDGMFTQRLTITR
jgi:hypothetical protein